MNKTIGIGLGILGFLVVSALVSKAFQKSPEQVAREQCENAARTSSALGINVPVTVYVEGVPHECD